MTLLSILLILILGIGAVLTGLGASLLADRRKEKREKP